MHSKLEIAEKIFEDLLSSRESIEKGVQPIYALSAKYGLSVSTTRLYLRAAQLPEEIKEWIHGQSDMPFMPFFIAAGCNAVFKADTFRVLMHAYHVNKTPVDKSLVSKGRITMEYLVDIGNDIGAYCNPRHSVKDRIPEYVSRLMEPDEYTREWCVTRINRLVCKELIDSLIAGTADDDSDSFYVKMPKRHGMELRRMMLIVRNMNEKTEDLK